MKTDEKTKIFLFEVHPLMVMGVQALIQKDPALELCGSSGKHDSLMEDLAATKPNVIILDLSLYARGSLDFITKIRSHFPDLGIIILSVHTEPDYVNKALQAGANSYVLKLEEPDQILDAVRATSAGESYVSGRLSQPGEIPGPPTDSPINLLSKQQLHIIQLIGKGLTNRQISEEVQLPVKKIEAETDAIQKKLDLSSPVELLQFAFHWVHHEGGFA